MIDDLPRLRYIRARVGLQLGDKAHRVQEVGLIFDAEVRAAKRWVHTLPKQIEARLSKANEVEVAPREYLVYAFM
jgi:hypothetical protein